MAKEFILAILPERIDEDLYDFPLRINLGETSGHNSLNTEDVFNELNDSVPTDIQKIIVTYINPDDNIIPSTLSHSMKGLDGDTPDTRYWKSDKHVFIRPGGTQIYFDTISIASMQIDSAFVFPSDFDISIGYDLKSDLFDDEQYLELIATDDANGHNTLVRLYYTIAMRCSMTSYDGTTDTGNYAHVAGKFKGRLRIKRVGSLYTCYYHDGTNYVALSPAAFAGAGNMRITIRLRRTVAVTAKLVFISDFEHISGAYIFDSPDDVSVLTQTCKAEIDRWDQVNKQAQIYVKVPYISKDVVTNVILNYDSTNADNSSNIGYTGEIAAQAVWTEYDAVYHLSSDGSDSTSSPSDGTLVNIDGTNVVDMDVGKGLSFNGIDESIDITPLDIARIYSISMNMTTPSVIGQQALIHGSAGGWFLNTDKLSFNNTSDGVSSVVIDTQYQIMLQDNTGSGLAYLNTAADAVVPDASNFIATRFGAESSVFANGFTGNLQEIRISTDIKTSAWQKAVNTDAQDIIVSFNPYTLVTTPPKAGIDFTRNPALITYKIPAYKASPINIQGNIVLPLFNKLVVPPATSMGLSSYTPISYLFYRDTLEATTILDSSIIPSALKTYSLDSTINYSDNIRRQLLEIVTSTIIYDTQLNSYHTKIQALLNSYYVSDNIHSQLNSLENIITTLLYSDILNKSILEKITSTFTFQDIIRNKVLSYIEVINTFLLSDTNTSALTLILSDTYNIDKSSSVSQVAYALLNDGLTFFGSVNFDGEEYLATTYVYNTQSTGITEYSNYSFNSYSWPYAAASNGIYKLDDADTDDGEEIQTSIKTGLFDFGTSLKKQVPYAYLGVSKTGRILFKTISTQNGVKQERWYEAIAYNNTIDTMRIKLGKGVKAKYWQFEILNIDGEDIIIESLELLPLTLKRRKN